MGLANERHEVMFAERMQGYVSHEDHLAMFFLEPNVQVPGWVLAEPGEEELVGFGDPLRRASQAFPFRVFADGEQYLLYGAFDPWPVYPMFGASAGQLHGKGELLVGCSSPVS